MGDPVRIEGHVYYNLTGYVAPDLFVRVEEVYGALMYWDAGLNREVLLTSFEQFEGGYWVAPFRSCPEEVGQGQVKRVNHDGPAGPISGVLEIRYRAISCADVGEIQEQYAENLGMLRRTGTTLAGPRSFDLISARVGNVTIDEAPNGRFSVSLGSTAGGSPVPATLRVQVNSAAPLTLSFLSGQEYDVTLRDAAAKSLWTWSADKTFEQSVHQRVVTDEFTATVDIPWPTLPDKTLQPGSYTVEAVITTGGVPAFSAIVPVTIAPASESSSSGQMSEAAKTIRVR